jgi:hypothetical protein
MLADYVTVGELIEDLQLLILIRVVDYSPSFGVARDATGRFIWLADGRPVLPWQFT